MKVLYTNNTKRLALALFLLSQSTAFAQTWDQLVKLVASDRADGDHFGYPVSISGDYAIVGAYQEDQDANGSNTRSNAGSAYIFVRQGSTWVQQQKIVASDRAADDNFGNSVAISGDYAIVGAWMEDEDASGLNTKSIAGSAYIFVRNGSTWSEQQKIVASDRASGDYFGVSVAINGDYAIVGAYYEDEDAAGLNPKSFAGSAYIFTRSGSTWSEQQKLVASDRETNDFFGRSVSISGDYAIVGAADEDENASNADSLEDAGSAYVFVRSGSTWSQQQKIVASDRSKDDNFGHSVAISGDYVIAGAYGEDRNASGLDSLANAGAAYIFMRSGSTWSEQQKIVASDREASNYFGRLVALSGDYVIAGAYLEDEDELNLNTLNNSGAAYIFKRNGTSWSQLEKIVASDRAAGDYFGYSVGISGEYAIVSAFYESEDASGGSTLANAGSAYIFASSLTLPVEITSFTAVTKGKNVELAWQTATEVNNHGFEIERRRVENWSTIGLVPGSGSSAVPRSYSYKDNNLSPGTYSYRLKQIDHNGAVQYSSEVRVDVGSAPRLFSLSQNYPNPFNPTTTIEFSVPQDGHVVLKIVDLLGRDVATLFEGEARSGYYQRIVFDATKMASGVYFSRLEFGGKHVLKKMVSMK